MSFRILLSFNFSIAEYVTFIPIEFHKEVKVDGEDFTRYPAYVVDEFNHDNQMHGYYLDKGFRKRFQDNDLEKIRDGKWRELMKLNDRKYKVRDIKKN